MLKKSIFLILTLLIVSNLYAQVLTEADYLKLNAIYTEKLINFVLTEETQLKKLENLKTVQKNLLNDLRLANESLNFTSSQLVQALTRLADLEDKKVNKTQIEAQLKAEKLQNLDSISRLNGQISSLNQELQALSFEISRIENLRVLIENKIDTQMQIRDLSNKNINSFEREINSLRSEISSNDREINSLTAELERLRQLRDFSILPEEKETYQKQIDQVRTQKQSLDSINRSLQATVSSEELSLINEKSRLRQIGNEIKILEVEKRGVEIQVSAQLSQKSVLDANLSSLKANLKNLNIKNKAIDKEFVVLTNLPAEIANTKIVIADLQTSENQQKTLVTKNDLDFKTAEKNTLVLQTKIESDKKALLTLEQTHNLTLAEFLKQLSVSASPVSIPTSGVNSIFFTLPILQSKDWNVFKGTSATLNNANICAASTRTLDQSTGSISELLVFKIVNTDGSHSTPLIITTFSSTPDSVFSGVLKTDRKKAVQLTLLQSPVLFEKSLIASYIETQNLISSFKADNRATVDFLIPGSKTTIQFSLRGSSVALTEFSKKCKN